MKSRLLLLIIAIVFISASAAFYHGYVRPTLEPFLKSQIEFLIKQSGQAEVSLESLRLRLILPGVDLKRVEINQADLPGKVTIEEIQVRLDLISLLGGQIAISKITALNPQIPSFEVQTQARSDAPIIIPWDKIFSSLSNLPVRKVLIENASVKLILLPSKAEIELQALSAFLENRLTGISLQGAMDQLTLKWRDQHIEFRTQFDFQLSRNYNQIRRLKIESSELSLDLAGLIPAKENLLQKPEGQLSYSLILTAEVLAPWREILIPTPLDLEHEHFSGRLHAEGTLSLDPRAGIRLRNSIKSKDLEFSRYKIGSINLDFSVEDGKFVSERSIKIVHPSGSVEVSDFKGRFKSHHSLEPQEFSFSIKTDRISLQKLLLGVGVREAPVELMISTHLDCKGQFPFQLSCSGEASGKDLNVYEDMNFKDKIVATNPFSARGQLQVDSEKVTYQAQIFMDDFEGASEGKISYEEGFDIGFSTPRLGFSSVKHLAGLAFEGFAQIQGRTWGNSTWARIDLTTETDQFIFENFLLGAVKGQILYKEGKLIFPALRVQQVSGSDLFGDLEVDLKRQRLRGHFESSQILFEDVQTALKRVVPIPFLMNGPLQGIIKFEGPFKIYELSYEGAFTGQTLQIGGERFDSLKVEVVSERGNFSFKAAELKKGPSLISMIGSGQPSGEVDFLIQAEGLPLSLIDNLSFIPNQITGVGTFSGRVSGHFFNPNLKARGQMKAFYIGDIPQGDVLLELQIDRTSLSLDAQTLNREIEVKWATRLDQEKTWRVQVSANKWRFSQLFSFFGPNPALVDYQSRLTGNLLLESDSRFSERFRFTASVDEFFLSHLDYQLTLKHPTYARYSGDVFQMEPFEIRGPGGRVLLKKQTGVSKELIAEAQLELKLISFFLPFAEDFRGLVLASGSLTDNQGAFNPRFDVRVKDGFLKIPNLIHPFERAAAEIRIEQNQFSFRNIYSDFAGGTLRGNGKMEVIWWNKIPLSFLISGNNLNLLIPQGIQSQGNVNLTLTGEFFPFKLAGQYVVQRGLIDQEVGQTKPQTRTLSPFFPPQLIQQRLKPLELQLHVILPSQLEVKNSMVRGTVTGEIFIKGTPDDPKLTGQILVNSGTRLVFGDRELEISTGRLTFNNPNAIDPELYVIAKGRIEGYEIDLLVQGTASNPLIQAQSSPALSQREVVSLIALGVVPGAEQATAAPGQQDSLGFGTQVGTVLLQNLPFFQKAQEATGLSVRLSSSFDGARETEVNRVTVRRNITDRLRATATGESFGGREFRLEYRLNRNLSAAGTYKQQENTPLKSSTTGRELRTESFFGFDLEYLREFK